MQVGLPHNTARIRWVLWAITLLVLIALFFSRHLLCRSWTLAALGGAWPRNVADFTISDAHDAFDVTFSSYNRTQLTAAPYHDLVPPIIHHIALGQLSSDWREEWREAAQSCLEWHPGWEAYSWTDESAAKFVAVKFPELEDMWLRYRHPIQRVDALRYMVLHEYGGVILDMDLKCKRALGPLRRFSFVAPEAHPTGFSISFMMASKHNAFVGDIVRNLTTYNKEWLGLPYPTVMFSTGGHFASVIHASESNRTNLKILPGPLHTLSGRVSTPLFDHLGSSSWHSYDAQLAVKLSSQLNMIFFFSAMIVVVLCVRGKPIVNRSWCRCMK
ncbi:putative glycosyl transferase [Thelonectria olida]|uniref:Glycosyl transferase n=1 Tax=Thelonectria olida TaxID=1576542 RepID=A0A9P8VSP0_9HYPO|nr:putative glycosyl transferase [Thelonectria olida]